MFLTLGIWNSLLTSSSVKDDADDTTKGFFDCFSFGRQHLEYQGHIKKFRRATYSSLRMKNDYLQYSRSFSLDFGLGNFNSCLDLLKKLRAGLTDAERAKDLYDFEVHVRRKIQQELLSADVIYQDEAYVSSRNSILELLNSGVSEYETKFPETLKSVETSASDKVNTKSEQDWLISNQDWLISTLDGIKTLVLSGRMLASFLSADARGCRNKRQRPHDCRSDSTTN